ncbi:MAG: hypothetical protein HYU74_06915, partial [Dechloromonas sp.]|nr:hypothetical protein [Dechloromonas sp.]
TADPSATSPRGSLYPPPLNLLRHRPTPVAVQTQLTDCSRVLSDHAWGFAIGQDVKLFVNDSNRPYVQVLEEVEVSAFQTQYVFGTDGPLSVRQGRSAEYLHRDAIGTVRTGNDETGTTNLTSSFEAFGRLRHRSGDFDSAYGFGGERWDPLPTIGYFRARYLDSETGRFLTADPVTVGSRMLNPYSYASSDPINRADPSGLTDFSLTGLGVTVDIVNILAAVGLSAARGQFVSGSFEVDARIQNKFGWTLLLHGAVSRAKQLARHMASGGWKRNLAAAFGDQSPGTQATVQAVWKRAAEGLSSANLSFHSGVGSITCLSAVAYVPALKPFPEIWLCLDFFEPTSFNGNRVAADWTSDYGNGQAITLLHEAAHWSFGVHDGGGYGPENARRHIAQRRAIGLSADDNADNYISQICGAADETGTCILPSL